MNRGPTIEDIKRAAQARLGEVLAALGVRERPSSAGYISMCNPLVKDRHPSFTIWTQGPAAGAWKDHRDDGPGGTRGDVIDLVSYLKGWWTYPKKGRAEALRWLTDLLALADISAERLEQDRRKARRSQAEHVKRRDEQLAEKQGRAFELFASTKLTCAEDPVRTYLEERGIALGLLPRGPRGGIRIPHCIRGLAKHKHTESGLELPCMIAGCTDTGTSQILAVHRTWLRPDCAGKADVTPVKKVWPDFRGLIIPLWRGESGLSVKEAIACGLRECLVLTEGIEDGLTAALAAPQHRVWAFISLGNLANVALPECIDSVMLHRQNEWENGVAVAAFDRGKLELERQGRPVVEVRAMYGKDLNDTQQIGAA